jgi:DNA replication protein DnaC
MTSATSKLGKLLLTRDSESFRAKVIGLNESSSLPKRLARYVEAWIKAAAMNRRENGTWMVISGPPGVGKSHALKAAVTFLANHSVGVYGEFWQRPPSVVWAAWSRIIELDEDEWTDWLYDLRRAQMVILDDVGSEVDRFKSGAPAERLRVALETCENRFLLVSTNIQSAQWASNFDERVKSRLHRAAVLDMTGAEDYRPNKKPENQH